MTSFSIFRHIEKNSRKIEINVWISFSIFRQHWKKNQVKLNLMFEYFWKYYVKWSICSKRANAPFSIMFFDTCMIFQKCQKVLLWSKVFFFYLRFSFSLKMSQPECTLFCWWCNFLLQFIFHFIVFIMLLFFYLFFLGEGGGEGTMWRGHLGIHLISESIKYGKS